MQLRLISHSRDRLRIRPFLVSSPLFGRNRVEQIVLERVFERRIVLLNLRRRCNIIVQ